MKCIGTLHFFPHDCFSCSIKQEPQAYLGTRLCLQNNFKISAKTKNKKSKTKPRPRPRTAERLHWSCFIVRSTPHFPLDKPALMLSCPSPTYQETVVHVNRPADCSPAWSSERLLDSLPGRIYSGPGPGICFMSFWNIPSFTASIDHTKRGIPHSGRQGTFSSLFARITLMKTSLS